MSREINREPALDLPVDMEFGRRLMLFSVGVVDSNENQAEVGEVGEEAMQVRIQGM